MEGGRGGRKRTDEGRKERRIDRWTEGRRIDESQGERMARLMEGMKGGRTEGWVDGRTEERNEERRDAGM